MIAREGSDEGDGVVDYYCENDDCPSNSHDENPFVGLLP